MGRTRGGQKNLKCKEGLGALHIKYAGDVQRKNIELGTVERGQLDNRLVFGTWTRPGLKGTLEGANGKLSYTLIKLFHCPLEAFVLNHHKTIDH